MLDCDRIAWNFVFVSRKLFLRYHVFDLCSYEIFLITSKLPGLIEVNVTHLVEAKVLDNFVAPLEVEVRNVFKLIDNFVDVHEVNDFE